MVSCRDSQGIDLFLRNLHVDYRTGARIVDRHISDHSNHLVSCFSHYVMQLHWFGRIPDNYVGSSGSNGSRSCYDF